MINEPNACVLDRATPATHPENLPNAGAETASYRDRLEVYLSRLLGLPVQIHSVSPLRGNDPGQGRGPGASLRIDYAAGGDRRRAVLEPMIPGSFGHELRADRVKAHLLAHQAFNRFPRHARSLDVGAVETDDGLASLGRSKEFFHLTEFVEGRPYGEDLVRLKLGGFPISLDRARTDALSDYLVEIHQERGQDPGLYALRIRELLGQGECIMGLIDGYPVRRGFIAPEDLEHLEHRCLDWRWRLKGRSHRLRRVHGDFHPWNILFSEGTQFTALNRSRRGWGEPAEDVTCLTMNYLFFALRSQGRTRETLIELFRRFWERYLEKTGDAEMLLVAAPFLAFQSLVLASPRGSPDLDETVRRGLFSFMYRVLEAPRFNPDRAEEYLRAD